MYDVTWAICARKKLICTHVSSKLVQESHLKYYVIIDLAPLKYLTASFRVYIIPPIQQSLHLYLTTILLSIVRSLSAKIGTIGTKRSVFLSPRLLRTNWNVFGGVMKFIIPGNEKLLFWNNSSECLFMFYSIIVFNNKVLGYFSKTWTWQQINGHIKFPVWWCL